MDVFDLFAKIGLDTSEYDSGLTKASSKLKSFASGMEKSFSILKSGFSIASKGFQAVEGVGQKAWEGLGKAAQAFAAASTAAAGGIALVGKSSFDAYADYEQLVGGIETLFKTSSGQVVQYADNAYKTAGLSANEYMELTTSFSASLLQSLGNDTAAAADKSNLAITDMSDNINKMGSTAQSVQDAYRGFAKQNFTMLDNLKLGYGGTKEEMQRLLADAEAVKASHGELASYSIESFSDIVDAIHVVQTEMGITGTTAKEASTTIQGSMAAAKGAWKNFMVGIADSNQDMTKLMDNLVESVVTAGHNVVPRIQEIVNQALRVAPEFIRGFAEVLPEFAKMGGQIIKTLVSGISEYMPDILESGSKLVGWIAQGIAKNAPSIAEGIGSLLSGISTIIGDNTESLLQAGAAIINGIFSAFSQAGEVISQHIGEFIPLLVQAFLSYHEALFTVGIEILGAIGRGLVENKDKVMEMASSTVRNIALAIGENAPAIIDGAIVLLEALANAFVENWPIIAAVGTEIILKLVEGVTTSVPAFGAAVALLFPHILGIIDKIGGVISIIERISPIVSKVVEFASSGITKILGIGKTLMAGVQGLFALITAHPVIAVITAIVGALIYLWNNCEEFREAVIAIWEAIVGFFQQAGQAIQAAWEGVVEFFQGVWQGIQDVFQNVGQWFSDVFTAAGKAVQDAWSAVVNFFQGVWQGIVGIFQNVAQWFGEIFSTAWNAIQQAWSAVVEFFSGIWEGIKGVFSTVAEVLGGFFSAAWEAIRAVWGAVLDFFSGIAQGIHSAFAAVTEFLGSAFSAAWEAITGVWDAAVGFFSGIWEGISGIFQGAAEWFGNLFSNAWNAITSAWGSVGEFFSGIWETITGAFAGAWDVFTEIGGNIVQGLWNGISGLAGWLWDKISGWVQSIWDGVKNFFGIHSPSTKFEWVGEMDVKGLARGTEKHGHEAVDAMKKVGRGMTDAARRELNAFTPQPIRLRDYAGDSPFLPSAPGSPAPVGNTTVNIYSPKAVDAVQAAREWKKTAQQLAMGF